MKITRRIIVSLVIVVAAVAFAFSFYQVQAEKNRLSGDLEKRAMILAESLQESIKPLLESGSPERLKRLVRRFGNREKLEGVAVYAFEGKLLASTPELAPKLLEPRNQVVASISENRPDYSLINLGGKQVSMYILPLTEDDQILGALALFHDASYIDLRLREIWKYNLLRFVILSSLIVIITLIVIRWSITGPIAQFAEWMRELRTGRIKAGSPSDRPRGDILAPLITEVAQMARSLSMARALAQDEARIRVQADSLWTAERLKEHMSMELGGKKLFLVSNREPYMHVREGREIKCIVPAGGLVTALDPVMRACDGVWVAHGGGEADRERVDANDKLRVPPEEPAYTLKRVWLTKEEEEGYYYGFSNEGLWPLCHITHTRPVFRLEDWILYQKVNEKFAEALLQEIEGEKSPLILIQDYHLALLPLLLKEKRPDAKIAIFWHIPWPNPESYGICPWRQEILLGMLGADIIGFHIQFHCNNFLDTVNRFMESKIEWEQFSVSRGGHLTFVKPFPISVQLNSSAPDPGEKDSARENLLRELGVEAKYLGMGLDRIDYTKGLPERFRAIERFLEKYPEFVGQFTFVELGAPSRTHLKRYRDLMQELDEMTDRINWRFRTKTWQPIVFLKKHHNHTEIVPYYRTADICMVTSLHDGMNLVAKEFAAYRDDEDGVLILSQFAGASRELKDAIIVNPYDIEGMADAIYASLSMKRRERTDRMKRMRAVVMENNVYLWAGRLITELARLRIDETVSRKRRQSDVS